MLTSRASGWRRVKAYGTILPSLSMAAEADGAGACACVLVSIGCHHDAASLNHLFVMAADAK